MISWLAGFQASMAHFLPGHRSYSGGGPRATRVGQSYRYPFILQFCLPYKFKNLLAILGLDLGIMNLSDLYLVGPELSPAKSVT